MYLYNQELHILYIININKQDITYLKDDLTCKKIVYFINNETSNLFKSSVITFYHSTEFLMIHLKLVYCYNSEM